jgi:hypothetical protein
MIYLYPVVRRRTQPIDLPAIPGRIPRTHRALSPCAQAHNESFILNSVVSGFRFSRYALLLYFYFFVLILLVEQIFLQMSN